MMQHLVESAVVHVLVYMIINERNTSPPGQYPVAPVIDICLMALCKVGGESFDYDRPQVIHNSNISKYINCRMDP